MSRLVRIPPAMECVEHRLVAPARPCAACAVAAARRRTFCAAVAELPNGVVKSSDGRHARRRLHPHWGRVACVLGVMVWATAVVSGVVRAVVSGEVHESVWPPLGLGLLVVLLLWLVHALRATVAELDDDDDVSDAALLAEMFQEAPASDADAAQHMRPRSRRWSA